MKLLLFYPDRRTKAVAREVLHYRKLVEQLHIELQVASEETRPLEQQLTDADCAVILADNEYRYTPYFEKSVLPSVTKAIDSGKLQVFFVRVAAVAVPVPWVKHDRVMVLPRKRYLIGDMSRVECDHMILEAYRALIGKVDIPKPPRKSMTLTGGESISDEVGAIEDEWTAAVTDDEPKERLPEEPMEMSVPESIPLPSPAPSPSGSSSRSGQLLYDIPATMQLSQRTRCRIRIAKAEVDIDEGIEDTPGAVSRSIKIGAVMQVTLMDVAGSCFEVQPLNDDDQWIEDGEYTEWLYDVTPLKTGNHALLLKVARIKMIDGVERRKERIYDAVIEVQATTGDPTAADDAPATRGLGSLVAIPDREDNSDTGKYWLALIGIDAYQHVTPLSNCKRDLVHIREELCTRFTFETNDELCVFDSQATEQGIYDLFDRLGQYVAPQDHLLICYSGHGIWERSAQRGYWLPVEARPRRKSTYLSTSVVQDLLRQLSEVQQIALLIDSCYSGACFGQAGSGGIHTLADIQLQRGRWAFTSGRHGVVSDGAPGTHSPFAAAVLDVLRRADGAVAFQELVVAATHRLQATADAHPRGEPLGGIGHAGGQLVFQRR